MKVAAIVLAAGTSSRMGSPKMLLSWGDTTVLGQVLRTVRAAGIGEIIAVVGSDRIAVEAVCAGEDARSVFNPSYEGGEMLSSIQVGLRSIPQDFDAALIVLGDQPLLEAGVIRALMNSAGGSGSPITVPSHMNRRGHPWLIRAAVWKDLLEMAQPQTPRDFLHSHAALIQHVVCPTDSILMDIDTPAQYRAARPK